MKPDTKLLHNVWKESKHLITRRNVEMAVELNDLLASVFSNGPFYHYVVDFFDMKIKYMNPAVKNHHGLDPETVTFQDILDQIHPDDMAFVAAAEKVAWNLLYLKLGNERNQKYKISYCFRFRTEDGSYRLYNHQSLMLSADEEGRMAKSLNIHTDISHLTSQNNYKISAIGMFGEPSFLNIDVNGDKPLPAATEPIFTKRETEIIRLLSEGLTSKEIAQRLSVADVTVNTHRKNILNKSGCRNLGQLITKCITHGLL